MSKQVIFYNEGGQPLAYFPNDKWDNKGNNMCYSHIGQHAACSPEYVTTLKLAAKDEYTSLVNELQSIGYSLSIIN